MAVDRTYIVCFGKDENLLQTCQLLLQQAGYATLATANAHLARESLRQLGVGIIILCHTLSDEAVVRMIRFHHDIRSTASILSLEAEKIKCALPFGDVFDTREGPAAFLAAIRKLGDTYHRLSYRPKCVQ